MFYKSREFCKVADCTNQKFLDDPNCPEATKVFLKEQSCPDCMAHKFHAYLQKEGFSIVKLPFSDVVKYGNEEDNAKL